jgi:hypothetical protein
MGTIQPSGFPGETPENRSGQVRQWKLAGEPPALRARRAKRYVKEHGDTTWGDCTLAGHEVKKKEFIITHRKRGF